MDEKISIGNVCEQPLRWFVGGSELVDDPKNGVVVDNSKEHKSKLQPKRQQLSIKVLPYI